MAQTKQHGLIILRYKFHFKLTVMKALKILAITLLIAACDSNIDFTGPAPEPPSPDQGKDLIISEIATFINTDAAAGGVRNHYVELYNGTGGTVDLSKYAIGYQAALDENTLTDWSFASSANYLLLTGSLEKGKCYVIASPQANANAVKRDIDWGTTSSANADASKPLQLSGNSGIALLKKDTAGTYIVNGVSYTIIDAFGSPNVARVTSGGSSSSRNNFMWTIAGETKDTRNRTIWRKGTVKDPNPDWATGKGTSASNSEWTISGDRAWDYSNLGLRSN